MRVVGADIGGTFSRMTTSGATLVTYASPD